MMSDCTYYRDNDFNILKNMLKKLITQTNFIYSLFFPDIKVPEDINKYINNIDDIKKNFNKLINKWNSENTKNITIKFFKSLLTYYHDEALKHYKFILKEIEKLQKMNESNFFNNNPYKLKKTNYGHYHAPMMPYERMKYFKDFYKSCNELQHILLHFHSFLTDLYFSRRFLDKSYITNGILYCGAFHGANIISLLIKEFDFKITHASHLKQSIEESNKLIHSIEKNSDLILKVQELTYPDVIYQCSSLEGFPENLT